MLIGGINPTLQENIKCQSNTKNLSCYATGFLACWATSWKSRAIRSTPYFRKNALPFQNLALRSWRPLVKTKLTALFGRPTIPTKWRCRCIATICSTAWCRSATITAMSALKLARNTSKPTPSRTFLPLTANLPMVPPKQIFGVSLLFGVKVAFTSISMGIWFSRSRKLFPSKIRKC